MSDQAFIVVPVPTQGDSHDVNTTSQHLSPDTKQQIAKRELPYNSEEPMHKINNAINGNKDGPHNSSSSTQYGQFSSLKDPLSDNVDSAQDLESSNKESEKKEDIQESATVKKIIDNPRGLLSLINWENPRLTLASLTTVVTLLLASRYFQLLQWVFKGLSVILGVVTAVEFVTRSTLGKSIILRVKPQKYSTVSESTFNRIFAEVREATQYIVVQAQKLIYGEDLSRTFIAFAVSFSLYWLIKLFTLWQLAVLVVPFVYTAPLVLSAQSKQQISNAADAATKTASATAAEVKDKAQNADLQQTGKDAADKVSSTVSNLKGKAEGTAKSVANRVSFADDNSLNSHHISDDSDGRIPSSNHSTTNGGEPFESSNKSQHVPSYTSDITQSTGASDSHVASSSNRQSSAFDKNNVPYGKHTYKSASPQGGDIPTTTIIPGVANNGYPSTRENLFGTRAKTSADEVEKLG